MNIGITYDLRSAYLAAGYSEEETAEFDQPATIDAIERALVVLGHAVDRIGSAPQLVERLAVGDRWDLVFNICEGLRGMGREAQVPAILDAYDLPYTFAEPATMVLCLDKALAKSVVRTAGLPTPDWLVVRKPGDLESFRLRWPVIAKPIAEGSGKGIDSASKVVDRAALGSVCDRLLTRYRQPVLLEEFLPGREFTVGILGTGSDAEAIGTLQINLRLATDKEVYSYENKENCEELVEYCVVDSGNDHIVAEVERIALAAWRVVGGRDAGRIDFRCDAAGRPQLMEINALPGIHPSHSDLPVLWAELGGQYIELIGRILTSARSRLEQCESRIAVAADRGRSWPQARPGSP